MKFPRKREREGEKKRERERKMRYDLHTCQPKRNQCSKYCQRQQSPHNDTAKPQKLAF